MVTAQAIDLIEAAGRKLWPAFTIDDHNRAPITACSAWLAREHHQGIDLTKGLLFIGHVGTGKTMLLRSIREAMMQSTGRQFGIRSTTELVRRFSEYGWEDIEPWITTPHAAFDDLCTEGQAVHYGERVNLMAQVIEARYERMMSAVDYRFTHFTTNMGTAVLRERYGDRAYDRLQQMCNVIDLGSTADAVNRRKGSSAPEPRPEPVSADNVYTAMHPDVAARIGAALGRAVKEVSVNQRPKSQSAEEHMAQFRERLAYMDRDQLGQLRDRLAERNVGESYVVPYLEAIDGAVDKLDR